MLRYLRLLRYLSYLSCLSYDAKNAIDAINTINVLKRYLRYLSCLSCLSYDAKNAIDAINTINVLKRYLRYLSCLSCLSYDAKNAIDAINTINVLKPYLLLTGFLSWVREYLIKLEICRDTLRALINSEMKNMALARGQNLKNRVSGGGNPAYCRLISLGPEGQLAHYPSWRPSYATASWALFLSANRTRFVKSHHLTEPIPVLPFRSVVNRALPPPM